MCRELINFFDIKKWTAGLAALIFCTPIFAQDLTQIKNEKPFRWTGVLQSDNTNLSGQVGDLAKKSEDQIRKTQSAKFKASSFKVEVGRRNEKQTIRAKKAREITVSFDLVDVPTNYQGDRVQQRFVLRYSPLY